ncbi:MAG: ATP-grasp domain-containing protein [Parachlamydiaceae bacterium]|nr:ATP-grasp domain-containing protein [Parachlamydiaceae bacterium]
MWKNKRVFISGGAGVIGTALVNQLIDQGADIFVGDLKHCPKEWLGKVKYRQGDLNEINASELIDFDPEVFFHLAATFERSEETFPFFKENFHHNIFLSHHLISCLKDAKSLNKVVFASSYLIYDPNLYQFSNPHEPIVLSENTNVYPRNICGSAKFFHEQELRFLDNFLNNKVSFICARIFRVYGKNSKDIISRWIRSALRHEPLTVYRSEGHFDYIFADDVAEGLIKLSGAQFSGIVNLGSGHSRSVKEVLEILKNHFPVLQWNEVSSEIPIESSQADMRLFEEITKWNPSHSLEEGINKLIDFERLNIENLKIIESPLGILITSISKKIPLLQAVRQGIDKLGHYKFIHGCDTDENCIGYYGVDTFWHCPKLSQMTVESVITYCKQHSIKSIIPTRNADLIFYAQSKKKFLDQEIHIMVSDLDTINNCLDKKQFSEVLIAKSFPVIFSALSLDKLDGPAYVVKERFGAGSTNLGINLSRSEAEKFARGLQDPIYQKFYEGIEWSVDLYRSRHGKVMGCVARQRNTVVNGESQVTTTASYPILEKLCKDIAEFLNIYGHAVIQVIENSNGEFHIIECNPRFGGASTAGIAVGLDSFYWFLLESLDQNIEEYPFMRSSQEIRQVRYPGDWILPWS